ncbi:MULTISPECIES: hypothetical protein [Rummeliibacillus]|uniref:hypothetical protein n=1 Tax=Rummeliibacillus TaxID=648802 RepID=UPI0011B7DD8E|nr:MULTISPECIES: hypothetical protein [Rummeliibacillus]MBO2535364.1 hypothetical protein [Rummeliibacillus suwonensis]
MNWAEVRQHFPNRCVLVEALQAETKSNQRKIEDMSVIDDFDNGNAAWKVYKKLHGDNQNRELYIFHTNNEETTVIEQSSIGVHQNNEVYNG